MANGTKRLVEVALYGVGEGRRFTLDSPILSDVWAHFFDDPGGRVSLLIEPWLDTAAFFVAEKLKDRSIDRERSAISYNRTVVVADLTLGELVHAVLPLTGWYQEIIQGNSKEQKESWLDLPTVDQMWQDLPLTGHRGVKPSGSGPERYSYPRLLSVFRIAGLILAMNTSDADEDISDHIHHCLTRLANGTMDDPEEARLDIARIAWRGLVEAKIHLPLLAWKIIYSIRRNRPAKLAVTQSVKTVKGDAATSLFSIDCGNLTWAIIDSGVDATHPAFRDFNAPDFTPSEDEVAAAAGPNCSEREAREARTALSALARSRVRETYDFSYLRDLLTNRDWSGLPAHIRSPSRTSRSEELPLAAATQMRRELLQRIRRSRLVDWELLRPFLRVGHDHCYVKPQDAHGTHVAGILGCNWPREGEPMRGMCPNINLIDVRVVRPDGTSDEFIIMSALQFIRHLNANADRIAVHGVNMSLSLEHDAAVYACGRTPICEEAERTVASGVVVVAAAGNHGYRRVLSDASQPFDQYCPVSITDPGNAENVITVGSTHRLEPHTYGISYFSSRGPTGDGRVKPDLVAPGEKIYAPAPNGQAMRLDGTSMAAPHVSGAAAMLMARHVELIGQPQRIKKILCSTATDLGREPYFQGKGLVDILRAIQSV